MSTLTHLSALCITMAAADLGLRNAPGLDDLAREQLRRMSRGRTHRGRSGGGGRVGHPDAGKLVVNGRGRVYRVRDDGALLRAEKGPEPGRRQRQREAAKGRAA